MAFKWYQYKWYMVPINNSYHLAFTFSNDAGEMTEKQMRKTSV